MIDYHDAEREGLPQAERLRQACTCASSYFTNPLLRSDLKEAADYFAALLIAAPHNDTEEEQHKAVTWKQIDERTFAVQSELLQMTEAGLRMAMYSIPKRARKNLLSFRWSKRYRDGQGKQWLEFEAA